MLKPICVVAEYLKFHRFFTVSLGLISFALAATAWLYDSTLEASLCAYSADLIASQQIGDADSVCTKIWETAAAVPAILLGVFFTISLSAGPQRTAVIHALLDGYINNFLRHVVGEHGVHIVIVKPGHEVIETGGITGIKIPLERDWISSLGETDGFEINDELIGDPARTVHIVTHPDFPGARVGVDFSRNLSSIRDTVLAESQSRFDSLICSEERKYRYIRDMYFKDLETEVNSLADKSRIRIVEGSDEAAVAASLKEALAAQA